LAVGPRAVAYATSLLRDRERAEEVVQDCFYRLLRRREAYDLPRDGTKLLFRAVTNACINYTARARRLVSLDALKDSDDAGHWEPADPRDDGPPVMRQELEAAIGAALARLPPQQRAALELKSLGHTQQDIAEILDISPTNAGVLVHRARQAMAAHLAPFLTE
jgi:RNA polymerase sigma-70 factor (ECF subfamily)